MLTQAEFLSRVERFLSTHRVRPSTFGRVAVKDPNFVFDLRKGRVPSLNVAAAVEQYMTKVESEAA